MEQPSRRTGLQRLAAAGQLASALAREPRYIAALPAWRRARTAPRPTLPKPWWPAGAIERVARYLRGDSLVFEYGAGGSTRWLAGLVAHVTTVEHDAAWYEEIAADLPDNVTLLLRAPDRAGTVHSAVEPGAFDAYVAVIDDQPDDSIDLVVVDGRARVQCGLAAARKVRPGGLLLLDDSQRRRYDGLGQALAGWPRTDVRGLKPREIEISQTTVWTRPG